MRVAVYSDLEYRRDDAGVSSNESFLIFIVQLARHLERLTLVGRLDPAPGRLPYSVPADVAFVRLAHYSSLARPWSASKAMARSLRRFWSALDDVDAVWLMGPHPLAIAFAAMAALRGRRIVLGTRQDMPEHMRSRHPDRVDIKLFTAVLESCWRFLARRCAMVAVGPQLARKYRGPRVASIVIPLVEEDQIVTLEEALNRSYDGELSILSVGRVEPEKNPLLLVDVLERLRDEDPRWRLVVCGEGSMLEPLRRRLAEAGLDEHADLRGFVALDGGLRDFYRESHAFLHVSFTEGVPQVLFEAFAAGTPIVATAVGGVADVADGAALLMPPADESAAVDALRRIVTEPALREELIESGLRRLDRYSLDEESLKVVRLLRG